MKLRIRGNSIRLRLSQEEVQRIGSGDSVEEFTNFPGGSCLRYALVPIVRGNSQAYCRENSITVEISQQLARDWASSQKVEIKFELSLGSSDRSLSVLVEKDFQCLKTRINENEDESGLFPNPNQAKGHC